MASSTDDTVSLTAQCLCKANTFKTTIPKAKLPLTAYVCHCDSCRHTSGALYTSVALWTEPKSGIDTSKLASFVFSPQIESLFCPTCSSPMFCAWLHKAEHVVYVFTGVLSNESEDLFRFPAQRFVSDTIDGGASVFLRCPNSDGSEAKRFDFNATDTELPQEWPPVTELKGYDVKGEDSVPIRCKCEGVNLKLHRGDYTGVKEEDLPFNVDPKTHKLLADLCGCNSCRIQSGTDVFCWTFAEIKYISFGDSDERFPSNKHELQRLVDAGTQVTGTLKYYNSSPGVHRYFCSVCSCCIFYTTDDRPELIDIAIGALKASDGARAEGFLSWIIGGPISYKEDGDGGWRQGLYEKVQKDGEEYRLWRGYPKNWKRLSKEKGLSE